MIIYIKIITPKSEDDFERLYLKCKEDIYHHGVFLKQYGTEDMIIDHRQNIFAVCVVYFTMLPLN